MNSQICPTLNKEIHDILNLLIASSPSISSKYFYDKRGSELFEAITDLPEYYPTRTEMQILKGQIQEINTRLTSKTLVVELGAGSNKKIKMLLKSCPNIVAYSPVDISKDFLEVENKKLQVEFPGLEIKSIFCDYTKAFSMTDIETSFSDIVIFYPGSSIGNFEPEEARMILESIINNIKGKYPESQIKLLLGVDLIKEPQVLYQAYNDSQNLTAEFNLNILSHINKLCDANFDLDKWQHLAFYNPEHSRIEMHLVSEFDQEVLIAGTEILFAENQKILTEYSYKYSSETLRELFKPILKLELFLRDPDEYFALCLFS